MKVQELLLELEGRFKAKPTNQTYDAYTNWLRLHHKRGVLGSGGSARVFDHPTDKTIAVKVFLAKDINYLKYAEWCMKNKSNPWVPKIHDIQFFKHYKGEEYAVVFMERLDKLPPVLYGKFLEDIGLVWSDFSQDQREAMKKVIANLKKRGEDPNLIKVLSFLFKNFQYFDLHRGNFLMRGRGQVVFVDPVGPPP